MRTARSRLPQQGFVKLRCPTFGRCKLLCGPHTHFLQNADGPRLHILRPTRLIYTHALTLAAAEVTWLREIVADILLVFLQHAELCLQSKPWSFRPQLPTVCSKICIVFSLCSALSCSVAMRYVGAIPVLAIPRCSPAEDEATFGSTSSWCACS